MKKNLILALTLCLFTLNLHAEDKTTTCLPQVGFQMAQKADSLDNEYKALRKGKIGIREGNGPGILPGPRDEAIILVHGFIATPFEVIDLGRRLNQEGYTVYMPLIPGFGSNAKVSNAYTFHKWRTTVADAVEIMSPCFKKISLIGFSLGGALVSEFILTQVGQHGEYKDVQIKSVGLLSTYYEHDQFGGETINWFLSLFTSEIKIKTLRNLTGHPDLKALADNPGYYLTSVPLLSNDTIIQYGKVLRKIPLSKKSLIPVFFSISDSDRTVEVDTAKEFVTMHFPQSEAYIIPESEKIPHQMVLGGVSKKMSDISSKVSDFVNFWNDYGLNP